MRIAQIAPLHEAVPPKLYGGTERVVSYLTEELVALGHEVTLFASGDSVTAARLHAAWPRSLRLDPDYPGRDRTAHADDGGGAPACRGFRRAAFSSRLLAILDVQPADGPVRDDAAWAARFARAAADIQCIPQTPVVSISNAQRLGLPQARFVATVPHGIPDRRSGPQPSIAPSYLAFLGRIAPEKGPDRAIRIARACGIPLRIAAKVDKADQHYFDATIRPMLGSPGVEMIGEISEREKPAFLCGAKALLMPIEWPEPFGLVMIEAMSCGTPVIAFNRGSVPEVVEDGLTGFIVEDEADAIAAVSRLDQLDRGAVRARFEQKFTARRMAEDYLATYISLAADESPVMRQPLRVIKSAAGGARSNSVT